MRRAMRFLPWHLNFLCRYVPLPEARARRGGPRAPAPPVAACRRRRRRLPLEQLLGDARPETHGGSPWSCWPRPRATMLTSARCAWRSRSRRNGRPAGAAGVGLRGRGVGRASAPARPGEPAGPRSCSVPTVQWAIVQWAIVSRSRRPLEGRRGSSCRRRESAFGGPRPGLEPALSHGSPWGKAQLTCTVDARSRRRKPMTCCRRPMTCRRGQKPRKAGTERGPGAGGAEVIRYRWCSRRLASGSSSS